MNILIQSYQVTAMKYLAWCLALKKSFAPEHFDAQFPEHIQQMDVPLSPKMHGAPIKGQLIDYALPQFRNRLSLNKSMGVVFARDFRSAAEKNGITDFELQ
ncbi:hypothetical protein OTK49_21375 [Vibrio coralliirubri]|uniref:hypothetical protein n=1 Tax=Vibrio coralliirubri TaxID=1516159 RepID=UPI0022844230|nr:hypothetical protein [Vibrio coralliirubri]MCY9865073.1 hypothetical protein [Vibrio coralliirubri]